MSELKKCSSCDAYTFKERCSSCDSATFIPAYRFPKIRDEPSRNFKRRKG